MASPWRFAPPYMRCTLANGDELSVVLGEDNPDDLSVPCDFFVRRRTGVRLTGTATTTRQLDEILTRWRSRGEGNNGGYIGLAHYVVLAEPTVDCLCAAIDDLAADDALANVFEVMTDLE
jgi:hypothetical protein